jgi:hypothetical protein
MSRPDGSSIFWCRSLLEASFFGQAARKKPRQKSYSGRGVRASNSVSFWDGDSRKSIELLFVEDLFEKPILRHCFEKVCR